ncbi:hypothetical protein KIN_18650 [Litoreibacter roseus]|uniref:Uncharacterized protein n=1 Tax=Litoreibacter roseus TaxID=2601869 RepID=A0A6N6JEL3_9RHOB|nr:hypothetical protein KIN_18650 [Litoreibacter roseus]
MVSGKVTPGKRGLSLLFCIGRLSLAIKVTGRSAVACVTAIAVPKAPAPAT